MAQGFPDEYRQRTQRASPNRERGLKKITIKLSDGERRRDDLQLGFVIGRRIADLRNRLKIVSAHYERVFDGGTGVVVAYDDTINEVRAHLQSVGFEEAGVESVVRDEE